MNLVRWNYASKAFQLQLPDGRCIDCAFRSSENALSDQDLAAVGARAEP